MKALFLSLLFACAAPQAHTAQEDSVPSPVTWLHNFTTEDGYMPRASLVLGLDGALYGTTSKGGNGCGSVYRWNGTFSVVYSFSKLDNTGRNLDGCRPLDPVSFHENRIWLSTSAGGNAGNIARPAPGAFVSMALDGTDIHLEHAFTGGVDGASPLGALVWLGDVAYGATHSGVYWYWNGTVNYLKSFPALYGSPVFGSDNLLHGFSAYGGDNNAGYMYSVNPVTGAFKIEYSFVAYTFPGNTDNTPLMSPILGSDGAIYFADEFGGTNGTGSVIKLERTATVLHEGGTWVTVSTPITPRFSGDGLLPIGTLVEVGDWIYGVSIYGGANGVGCIFRIKKDGRQYQVLYSFNLIGGCYPSSGLTIGLDKALYGVTQYCGTGGGALYRFEVPL
jgi:uncharacterized repeat protein (TIGR03803 family)